MSLFECPGNIHPLTYDWKKDFGGLAQSTRETRLFYMEVDMSRVLGLAQYTEELEEQVKTSVSSDVFKALVNEKEVLEKEVKGLQKQLKEKTEKEEKKKPGPQKKEEDSKDLF
jgi:hypothetical protein